MKLHVEVKQEDIDLGCAVDKIGAEGGCMVYRAFMRATEGAFPFVVIEWESINLYHSKEDALIDDEGIGVSRAFARLKTPPFVKARICDFDDGNHVEPFSFDIDFPTKDEADAT